MSLNENEQPRPGLPNRGRWISAAQTPAPDVPPAAPERRPRSSRCWDPTPSSGPPTSPSYPATRPSNSSPGWRQPTSPPARRLVTPQTRPVLTDPGAWRPALWLRPPEPLIPAADGARPGHHADPSREVRATADLALEHVTRPHTSSATSSNRYINGRSAYSAGSGDQAPEPVNS